MVFIHREYEKRSGVVSDFFSCILVGFIRLFCGQMSDITSMIKLFSLCNLYFNNNFSNFSRVQVQLAYTIALGDKKSRITLSQL